MRRAERSTRAATLSNRSRNVDTWAVAHAVTAACGRSVAPQPGWLLAGRPGCCTTSASMMTRRFQVAAA